MNWETELFILRLRPSRCGRSEVLEIMAVSPGHARQLAADTVTKSSDQVLWTRPYYSSCRRPVEKANV